MSSNAGFVHDDGLIEACIAGKAPRSQVMYRLWLTRFKEWCGDRTDGLLDVTTRDVEHFFRSLHERELSDSTMSQAHTALRTLFKFAVKHDLIVRSPMDTIEAPRVVYAKPPVLSKAVLSELLIVARRLGSKEAAVIALFGVNGLRPTEIFEGTVDDLSRRGEFWVLKIPSRSSTSFTVLPEVTSVPLLADIDGRTNGPLMLNQYGKSIERHSLSWIVTKVANHAGVGDVTPQALRNTMVALALQLTADIHGVQEAAGYSDLRQLGRITAGDPSTRGHIAVRLARALEATLASEDVLEQAESLLSDPEVHPIAPIVLAGAMLEARLRSLCIAEAVTIEAKAGIDRYATALKSARVLTRDDFRQVQRLADIRNDAAH